MTAWDRRTFARALGATLIGLVVAWLVTAASDEGQLTVGVRAGRVLPLAPLCSAVGAALALGTARIRLETRALEALGRSPSHTALFAAIGAALPSVVVALAIGLTSAVDVSGFYPRAPRSEVFTYDGATFSSPSLGVRVREDGEPVPLEGASSVHDEGLPTGARPAAAAATGLAGIALAMAAALAILRVSLLDGKQLRRRRATAAASVVVTSVATLVAFQAAAAHIAPAVLSTLPPALLFLFVLLGYRSRHEPA